jgi:cell division protease FtsH
MVVAVGQRKANHALVAELLLHTDPVHRVSIIPTSKDALGYTMQMPEEDQYLMGQTELEERTAVMLGGRAAELLVLGEPSTGASTDLERATTLVRRMVTEFGMTEALGPVRYQAEVGTGYLGYQGSLRQDLSPETAALIDQETRRLVEEAQERALSLLGEHRGSLDEIARVPQETEVIGGDEIRRIAQNGHGEEQTQVKES